MASTRSVKSTLRVEYLRKRKEYFEMNATSFTWSYYNKYADDILKIIQKDSKSLSDKEGNINISGFAPIKQELDCLKIFEILHSKPNLEIPVKLCLPCTSANTKVLTFKEYVPNFTKMIKGLYNIPEPEASSPILPPHIILIPMLAFNNQLYRLGYGGGYYDFTLYDIRAKRKVLAVGLAMEFQKIDDLPLFPHDLPMDYIITEKKLYSKL